MRRALLAILLLGLTALAPATVASAATSPETIRAILRDCEDDGSLSGSYRPSELRDAVRNIGTDLDQYSACRDVISAAVLRTVSRREAPGASGSAAGGGGGAGSSTGGGGTSSGGESSGGAHFGGGAGSSTGGGGTSSGGESSGGAHFGGGALLAPDGPEEVAELSRVRDAPPESAVLGGRPVQLGLARYLYATHEPPTPLLVALALLTLGALVAGVPSIRRRLVDRRAA